MTLTTKQISYLRGLAHHLTPAVQGGKAGMSAAIVKEVDRNLKDHELIKVKVPANDWDEFVTLAEDLATQTSATLVQTIGRIAVLYREGQKPVIQLPKRKPANALGRRSSMPPRREA